MNGNDTKYPNAHQKPANVHRSADGISIHNGIVIRALTARRKVLMNIWSLIIFLRKISGTTKRRTVGMMETTNRGKRIRRASPLST